jgi:hypothetical protein
MNDRNPDVPELHKLLTDLLGRLTNLEREVAVLRTQRPSLSSLIPYTPPSEEELRDMLESPRGQPLLEIIEEYEKKYLGA